MNETLKPLYIERNGIKVLQLVGRDTGDVYAEISDGPFAKEKLSRWASENSFSIVEGA